MRLHLGIAIEVRRDRVEPGSWSRMMSSRTSDSETATPAIILFGSSLSPSASPGRSFSSKTEGNPVSRLPSVCLVLITPDSSEIRWVFAVPKPGVRIHGRFPGTWLVVDEVLQCGVMTYTVFGSTAPEGLIGQARDLAADAVEQVQESVAPATIRPSLVRSASGG
jgi:hypothetical protein